MENKNSSSRKKLFDMCRELASINIGYYHDRISMIQLLHMTHQLVSIHVRALAFLKQSTKIDFPSTAVSGHLGRFILL